MNGFLKTVLGVLGHNSLTESKVRAALAGLSCAPYISSVKIFPKGKVMVTLEVESSNNSSHETMRREAEESLRAINGVHHPMVILTAERAPAKESSSPPQKPTALNIIGVKKIIVVSSGKGGVGKSTVAANLAVSLSQSGLNIGLMDGDIYGPSVPRLFGVRDQKPEQTESGKIIPITAHGIKIMSMGFMVAEAAPMIWRGPIVQSAIMQLLRDVVWGTPENPLDILVIDMPPGTGDAHLTLAQKARVNGAVIVSTPQDLALIDARKGLEMYRAVHVPILGIVENMSYYCCPECGHKDDVFGHGGARREAEKLGVNFLGEVPLNSEIRKAADEGRMVPEFYSEIVKNIVAQLNGDAPKEFPKIIFES